MNTAKDFLDLWFIDLSCFVESNNHFFDLFWGFCVLRPIQYLLDASFPEILRDNLCT
jgi:hypothetical protein